ncbi:MAG: ester cyclase [Chloroflexi bacterium]|nr:ester cyclase [Chloroflexota bacterium]MCY3582036.1 ester cyclase [Chloroflexota bacterium]MCY3717448.1 ester cyclase [Chloroflexota bacterium]MDE2651200.1 ester cyclase [Chloroflexota bacterium]MYA94010.1 ester cyclase [Chloroflexota bacterium]
MVSIHNQNKERINLLRDALYDIEPARLPRQLGEVFAADCEIHLATPLEDLTGPAELFDQVYAPLLHAIPDLERRDFIVMAGHSPGQWSGDWVGCGGHYMGVFEQPWLDIPPTRHLVSMRYHEFFRFVDGAIVEMQALWDIPSLMMQARAWPLSPSLAPNWSAIPGPASGDGFIEATHDPEQAAASVKLVMDMLKALRNSPQGVAAMELDRYWHPQMMWYGPAGIGVIRRVLGFRNWHQTPFLKAMPDRFAFLEKGVMFGDGEFVGFTAWPGGQSTLSGDGWLGIPPTGKKLTRRSLDFWRCENGLIRENWVLVDLLHIYAQLGVDVFERMRELTIARQARPMAV